MAVLDTPESHEVRRMIHDTIVSGAGLAGLAAAAILETFRANPCLAVATGAVR